MSDFREAEVLRNRKVQLDVFRESPRQLGEESAGFTVSENAARIPDPQRVVVLEWSIGEPVNVDAIRDEPEASREIPRRIVAPEERVRVPVHAYHVPECGAYEEIGLVEGIWESELGSTGE